MDQSEDEEKGSFFWIKRNYTTAVIESGGIPLPLPVYPNPDAYFDILSGIIITGGNFDINPSHYGQKNMGNVRILREDRTRFELNLLQRAWEKGMPILGICGGAQLINVFRGGTLSQHVEGHERKSRQEPICSHEVQLKGLLKKWFVNQTLHVNSTHHQAIDQLGTGLKIAAQAMDGVIEAVETTSATKQDFCIGVQWHPEALINQFPEHQKLYQKFIESARKYKEKKVSAAHEK
jgi:putative glutamine amidotransferase